MKTSQIKLELQDIIQYIIAFYKKPFENVKKVPSWTWVSLFLLIFIFSSLTGVLRGLFAGSLIQSIVGFFFLPISAFISVALITCYCYFTVVVFKNRNLNFKRLFTLTFVAFLPTITMYTLSLVHPTVTLLGITFSFFLLYSGLINRFQLSKKFTTRIVGLFYAFVLVIWIIGYFNLNSSSRTQNFIDTENKLFLDEKSYK